MARRIGNARGATVRRPRDRARLGAAVKVLTRTEPRELELALDGLTPDQFRTWLHRTFAARCEFDTVADAWAALGACGVIPMDRVCDPRRLFDDEDHAVCRLCGEYLVDHAWRDHPFCVSAPIEEHWLEHPPTLLGAAAVAADFDVVLAVEAELARREGVAPADLRVLWSVRPAAHHAFARPNDFLVTPGYAQHGRLVDSTLNEWWLTVAAVEI